MAAVYESMGDKIIYFDLVGGGDNRGEVIYFSRAGELRIHAKILL